MILTTNLSLQFNGYATNTYSYDFSEYFTLEDSTVGIKVDDYEIFRNFLYFQKFNIAYNDLSWYLEPGAREFLKDFDNRWMHNQIDEFGISHSLEFKKFITDYFDTINIEKLSDEVLEEAMEEYENLVEEELSDLSQAELKSLDKDADGDGYINLTIECLETNQLLDTGSVYYDYLIDDDDELEDEDED